MNNRHREEKPLVSIITVNFNQTAVTLDFLDSVRAQRYPHFEVIVVDNGSTEPPGAVLQEHYPEVLYLETGRNLGFSGGNNVGLRAARGAYFLLVNNDTVLTPDMIDTLLQHFQSDPSIGMVCPLIRYHDRPDLIQYAGYTRMNPLTARNKTIGQFDLDRGQYRQPASTWFAHGAAMFTSREVVEKAGMMPEEYFLYYEELDWSANIREAGYRIDLEPRAIIFHKESLSVGKLSTTKTYYMTRNRILFMRRHASWWSLLIFLVYFGVVVVPVHTARFLLRGQREHLRAFYRALAWHIKPATTAAEQSGIPRLVL
jgi:GT2 family glycosyltransferase